MIKTIIIAILTYLGTSIDEIPVLYLLYKDSAKQKKGIVVTLSYLAGTFILIAAGLLGAFGLVRIPMTWLVGFIGLIPIIMGIKIFVDGDDDEEKALSRTDKLNTLWIKVILITLALGVDDLGVYIPLFTTTTVFDVLQMLIVFFLGTLILCLISYRLTHIEVVENFIERKERFITGTVFVAIGLMVLYECGTFKTLFHILFS